MKKLLPLLMPFLLVLAINTEHANAVPDIRGEYSGSYTTVVSNCTDPESNGTYNAVLAMSISTQTGNTFSGSATGTFNLDGLTVVEYIQLSGTITESGQISGTTSHTFLSTGGEGTFTGQLSGNNLSIENPGHDTYGETCNYIRTMSATRPGIPPSASFSAIPTDGNAPLNVNFTDQSTGAITSWSWDFGDGTNSSIQSPSHTYSNDGKYTVTLTVSGPYGSDTETKTEYISVTPSANFSAIPTNGNAPLSVNFTDESTGTITSRIWNFGDGASSAHKNPSHTYSCGGNYTVSLTVSGPYGLDSETKIDYISVVGNPPSASFSAIPTSGISPLSVNFTNESTGIITSWSWNFGDGTSIALQNPSHTYSCEGNYSVSLTVSGPCGSDTKTETDYISIEGISNFNEYKIYPSDGAAYDYFGSRVSIAGDTAIVGVSVDDDNGEDSGSAYIFKKNGRCWNQVAKLTASDGAVADRFGDGVAISGDYAIVGARNHTVKGTYSGSAYIFEKSGNSWNEVAKITPSDGAAYDYFGSSVSISGDTVIVGAPGDDGISDRSGSAYIFEKNSSSWDQITKLTESDGANISFGNSVSISGNSVIVRTLQITSYVYERNGSSWNEMAKLTLSDVVPDAWWISSVAISGDYAIVGARYRANEDSIDSVLIFERRSGIWSQVTKLTPSDGAFNTWFGLSVAISGDYAIVGASNDDDNGIQSGSAYVYKRSGGIWSQVVKLTPSDGIAWGGFGYSVSISGDYAIVGAYKDDDNGFVSGSAYIFDLSIPGSSAMPWIPLLLLDE